MRWFRIAFRHTQDFEERQFPGLSAAREYARARNAVVYAYDCGWRLAEGEAAR